MFSSGHTGPPPSPRSDRDTAPVSPMTPSSASSSAEAASAPAATPTPARMAGVSRAGIAYDLRAVRALAPNVVLVAPAAATAAGPPAPDAPPHPTQLVAKLVAAPDAATLRVLLAEAAAWRALCARAPTRFLPLIDVLVLPADRARPQTVVYLAPYLAAGHLAHVRARAPAAVLDIVADLAAALQETLQLGLPAHGNLALDNCLVTQNGRILLAGFGRTRVQRAAAGVAEEQDVRVLAGLLVELATGARFQRPKGPAARPPDLVALGYPPHCQHLLTMCLFIPKGSRRPDALQFQYELAVARGLLPQRDAALPPKPVAPSRNLEFLSADMNSVRRQQPPPGALDTATGVSLAVSATSATTGAASASREVAVQPSSRARVTSSASRESLVTTTAQTAMGATAMRTPAPAVDGISGDPRTCDRTVVVDRITNHAVDAPDPRDISWLVLDASRDLQSQQLIYKALFKRPIGKRPIIALKALFMLFSVLQEGPPEFALLTVSNDKFLEWAQNEWSIENVRGKQARREYAACFSDGSIAAFTRIIRRKAAFHRDYAQAFMPDWRPVFSSIDRALALRHAVAVTAILHIFNGVAALFRAFSSASDTAASIKGACATRLAAELSATFQAARLVYDRMDKELDRIDMKEDIDNALVTLQSTLGAVTASSDISSLSNFAAVKKARADDNEKKAAKMNKPKGVEKNEGYSKGCKTSKIVASGVAADSAVPESSSDTSTPSSERADTEKERRAARLADAGDKNREDDAESIPVLASFENLSDKGEDVQTSHASKKRVKVRRSKSKPPADAGSESDDEAADVNGQGNVANGSARATDARRNRDMKSSSERVRSRKSDCVDPRYARDDDESRTGVGHDNISDDEIERNHVSSNANENDRDGKIRDVRSRASRIRKQTRTSKGVSAFPRDSDVRRPVATRRRAHDGYDSSGSCHSSQGSGSGHSVGGYSSADAADAESDDDCLPRSRGRKSKSRPDASARSSNAFRSPVRNKQSDTLGKIRHRRSEQRPAAPPVSRPSAPSPRPNVSPSAVDVVRGSPAALAAAAHGFKTPRMDPRYEIEPHEVRFGNQIGSGGFGVVFKGKFRGETVAIKKIHAHALNNRASIDEFRAEVSVLCTLRHPNILSFLGACVKAPNLMIVTEFMARGTLFDILHQSQMSVTWAMRRKMALDTCRGMRYLHESKLLHRDLKSSNLMLDNDFNCKVGDFGLTRISKGAVAAQMTGQCGTFQYMAVEVLASKPYSEKADVFSFGILLWELVARKLPYFGMQPMQVGLAVVQRGLRPTIPPTCPGPLAKLMQACWDNSPNRRPSFEQIERSLTAMPEAASVAMAPA